MLSNCIFDVLNTTFSWINRTICWLWFAFKLYLWRIEHNITMFKSNDTYVVICFQIVSLTYWTQLCIFKIKTTKCCDLLSNCIFDVLNTTLHNLPRMGIWLWFAFKLYLWRIEHNFKIIHTRLNNVVICFQIVSLTYWTQLNCLYWKSVYCCDLLSNCIFDVLNTTYGAMGNDSGMLWFAFKLYLWRIEHNIFIHITTYYCVVICFQIVSLTYWTQHFSSRSKRNDCCDLLSNCIFDVLNTTKVFEIEYNEALWFAFKLYLWRIEHNRVHYKHC